MARLIIGGMDEAPLLVHVARVSPALARGVRAVEVAPEQAAFVGNIAINLAEALDDPDSEAMAILANGRVVGFYRLDFSQPGLLGPRNRAPAVSLRSFAIDRREQGQGHGLRAMQALLRDLARRHPRCRLLVLAVNRRNDAARRLYARCGLVRSGLVVGGRAGPQDVLLRLLPANGRQYLYV